MKKYLLLVLSILFSLAIYGQEYDAYVAQLHTEPFDKDFPDQVVGLKITKNKRTILKTNPIFDRVCTDGDVHKYSACRIHLCVKGEKKDLFYSNEIWVALDEDFKLLFCFPVGTQDAYYNEEYDMFEYTTHASFTYDFWSNFGLVDLNGCIVSQAKDNSFCTISHRTVVTMLRDKEDNNDTLKLMVQYKSLDDMNDMISVTLKVPLELEEKVFFAEDFEAPFFKDDPFISAIVAFYHAEDMSKIAAKFREATKTDDRLFSDCARYNENAIKSALNLPE